ncbi:MAG TPA: DUF4340 domain-containing protein [Candidatus Acidoferrum sp.]|nr:DUF4340 domain-containing protein [Candidatus Acidoferrum sp.]
MKSRGLIVAVIVLTALTGTLYWSNRRKPAESSVNASAETPPKILTLNQADITEVAIKKKGGEEVTLAKNDAGKWQITAPKQLRADQDAVSSMLSTLSALNSDRLIEDKASNLDQYGLTQPSIEVDVTEKNKKSEKLLIGDETPSGSAAYAAVDGDLRVFTVASYYKNSFDKGSKDLRNKRLMTFESDKISRVELLAKKQAIEFGRNKEQWQIVKPGPFRADGFRVDELVRNLSDAKMDLSGSDDGKKAAAAFNSGAPVATAKVTDASGTQELQLRKNRDDYYAKSSAVEGVYKVLGAVGSGLDKSVGDFRNKKLFDFGYANPEKVELHDGLKSYSLSRSGDDWSSNGAKMDAGSVSTLVSKIRDLSASKFADNGFTTAIVDITVASNDGKRVEKVLIAKNGDRYVAKRENEPALYELNAADVTELQKSAADLKRAAAPKK